MRITTPEFKGRVRGDANRLFRSSTKVLDRLEATMQQRTH